MRATCGRPSRERRRFLWQPCAATRFVAVHSLQERKSLVPTPISPGALFDTADRLGAIEAVKRKLVKQPDPAAAKLVTVFFEELSKIYGVLEDELTTYLALFFDNSDPKQLARERAALGRLEGGAIRAEWGRGGRDAPRSGAFTSGT